jgi:hypothetical protein
MTALYLMDPYSNKTYKISKNFPLDEAEYLGRNPWISCGIAMQRARGEAGYWLSPEKCVLKGGSYVSAGGPKYILKAAFRTENPGVQQMKSCNVGFCCKSIEQTSTFPLFSDEL